MGTLFIEPGSPWENGYVASFNDELREELDREFFWSHREAMLLAEQQRRKFNTVTPHRAPGYRSPAPEAILLLPPAGAGSRWRQLWLQLGKWYDDAWLVPSRGRLKSSI